MDPKWTSGNELKYLEEVLQNSNEVKKNPFTDRLEEAFCRKYGVKYAIAVNSGTSGLHSCLNHDSNQIFLTNNMKRETIILNLTSIIQHRFMI